MSTVVGFPHGSNVTATKVFEACLAVADGATELDMVLNIGFLRSGLLDRVQADIAAVVSAVAGRAIVKVILENALLTDAEKVAGCRAVEAAGAHFVRRDDSAVGERTSTPLFCLRSRRQQAFRRAVAPLRISALCAPPSDLLWQSKRQGASAHSMRCWRYGLAERPAAGRPRPRRCWTNFYAATQGVRASHCLIQHLLLLATAAHLRLREASTDA